MSQNRPKKSYTRQVSSRSPPIHRQKSYQSPAYIYSPRTKIQSQYKKYNSNLKANRRFPSSTKVPNMESKSQNLPKNQKSTNWVSSLGDISFPSNSKPSTSCTPVSPSAYLLFPSPTSPKTRTPATLRQIIDDSGFQILRESPLSAKDSYYARDINDNNVTSDYISSKPNSMRYSNNSSNISNVAKPFITNTVNNDQKQGSEQVHFKLNNLNDNSNVNDELKSSNTKSAEQTNSSSFQVEFLQREAAMQNEKRADLEKLFDMTDFNLDKFDMANMDLNDEPALDDVDENDIKIELSENNTSNSKSSNSNLAKSPKINDEPTKTKSKPENPSLNSSKDKNDKSLISSPKVAPKRSSSISPKEANLANSNKYPEKSPKERQADNFSAKKVTPISAQPKPVKNSHSYESSSSQSDSSSSTNLNETVTVKPSNKSISEPVKTMKENDQSNFTKSGNDFNGSTENSEEDEYYSKLAKSVAGSKPTIKNSNDGGYSSNLTKSGTNFKDSIDNSDDGGYLSNLTKSGTNFKGSIENSDDDGYSSNSTKSGNDFNGSTENSEEDEYYSKLAKSVAGSKPTIKNSNDGGYSSNLTKSGTNFKDSIENSDDDSYFSNLSVDALDDTIPETSSSEFGLSEPQMSINIFGDVSSFLYPGGGRQNQPSSASSSNSAKTGQFSSYKHPVTPPRSSFKNDDSESRSPRNGRKSVTFILPENEDS